MVKVIPSSKDVYIYIYIYIAISIRVGVEILNIFKAHLHIIAIDTVRATVGDFH